MIRLVSFEGGDGSGKTTQLMRLEGYLSSRGKPCLCTREPGGTALGEMIRQVLLEAGKIDLSSPTELFLYLADRAQHVQEIIRPALSAGQFVLCDRFTDSTLAYQGYGRGIDLDLLRQLNHVASRGIQPDLTFLLDCPVAMGLSRTARRIAEQKGGSRVEDRFEREKLEFHERVRKGFLELAQAAPERIHVVDASRSIDEVHGAIKKIVDQKLEGG